MFAENASFRSYGVICLPRLTTPERQNTDTNGIHCNVSITLLFAVLTKNDSFEVTAHSFTFAHGHELSGCVRADAYNLI